MTKEQTLATVRKNDFTEVRLVVSDYEDATYVHLRTYVRTKGEDEWRPTSKGACVRLEHAMPLCEGFKRVAEQIN